MADSFARARGRGARSPASFEFSTGGTVCEKCAKAALTHRRGAFSTCRADVLSTRRARPPPSSNGGSRVSPPRLASAARHSVERAAPNRFVAPVGRRLSHGAQEEQEERRGVVVLRRPRRGGGVARGRRRGSARSEGCRRGRPRPPRGGGALAGGRRRGPRVGGVRGASVSAHPARLARRSPRFGRRARRGRRGGRRGRRRRTRRLVALLLLPPNSHHVRGRRRNPRGDPRSARFRGHLRPRGGDPRPRRRPGGRRRRRSSSSSSSSSPPRRGRRSRSVSSAVPLPEPRPPGRRFVPLPRVPPLVPPRREPHGGFRRPRRGRGGARRTQDGEDGETPREEGEATIETTRPRHQHHGRRRLRETADHHATRAVHADRSDGGTPIATHRRVVRGRRRRRARGGGRRSRARVGGAVETGRGRRRAPRLSIHMPRAEPIRTRPRGVGVIAAQLPGVVRARPRRGRRRRRRRRGDGAGDEAGGFGRRTIGRRRGRWERRGTSATFERRRGVFRVGERSREGGYRGGGRGGFGVGAFAASSSRFRRRGSRLRTGRDPRRSRRGGARVDPHQPGRRQPRRRQPRRRQPRRRQPGRRQPGGATGVGFVPSPPPRVFGGFLRHRLQRRGRAVGRGASLRLRQRRRSGIPGPRPGPRTRRRRGSRPSRHHPPRHLDERRVRKIVVVVFLLARFPIPRQDVHRQGTRRAAGHPRRVLQTRVRTSRHEFAAAVLRSVHHRGWVQVGALHHHELLVRDDARDFGAVRPQGVDEGPTREREGTRQGRGGGAERPGFRRERRGGDQPHGRGRQARRRQRHRVPRAEPAHRLQHDARLALQEKQRRRRRRPATRTPTRVARGRRTRGRRDRGGDGGVRAGTSLAAVPRAPRRASGAVDGVAGSLCRGGG